MKQIKVVLFDRFYPLEIRLITAKLSECHNEKSLQVLTALHVKVDKSSAHFNANKLITSETYSHKLSKHEYEVLIKSME